MAKREIPVLFQDKAECCGCGLCYNVCPQDAIEMKEDFYGVSYPEIAPEKCVACGKCAEACRFRSPERVGNVPLVTLAAVAADKNIRLRSSSGGAFAAFAGRVLRRGGIVVGASMEEGGNVCHRSVSDTETLSRLQGSKYAQSDAGLIYREVKRALRSGREVLFSGTPCQVDALRAYVGEDGENLYCIDLLCHGTPGGGMFRAYVRNLESERNAKVTEFLFRDKALGWGANGSVTFSCGSKKLEKHEKLWQSSSTYYYYYYLEGLISRESCYHCKYACEHRPGDITLGDYWGIESAHPECLGKGKWDEREGVSLVVVNTEKGQRMLSEIGNELQWTVSDFQKAAARNAQLRVSSALTEREAVKRRKLLDAYASGGWAQIEAIFHREPVWKRYQSQLKALVPTRWKRTLKKIYRRL